MALVCSLGLGRRFHLCLPCELHFRSQLLTLGLNYTTRLPGSPAYTHYTMAPLSLYISLFLNLPEWEGRYPLSAGPPHRRPKTLGHGQSQISRISFSSPNWRAQPKHLSPPPLPVSKYHRSPDQNHNG